MFGEYFFEGDFAIDLFVARDRHLSQPAALIRFDDRITIHSSSTPVGRDAPFPHFASAIQRRRQLYRGIRLRLSRRSLPRRDRVMRRLILPLFPRRCRRHRLMRIDLRQMVDRLQHRWVAGRFDESPSLAGNVHAGQRLERIIAVPRQMHVDQAAQQGAFLIGEDAVAAENLCDRPATIAGPLAGSRDQLVARDEVELQRQHPNEQVAIGS